MELGALVCTPRQPKCDICPVAGNCIARRQGRTDRYPNLGRREASIPRRFVAFVLRRGSRYLVRQRPAGGVNAHLWEFPNIEWNGSRMELPEAAGRAVGFTLEKIEPLCTLKHSITRYRITLEAYTANGERLCPASHPPGRWLTVAGLKKLSFPSAHRKILLRLAAV